VTDRSGVDADAISVDDDDEVVLFDGGVVVDVDVDEDEDDMCDDDECVVLSLLPSCLCAG
jgi:hypothetical protein